jgi:hypothetical protein
MLMDVAPSALAIVAARLVPEPASQARETVRTSGTGQAVTIERE